MAIDIILRMLGQGADKVESDINKVGSAAKKAGDNVDKIGKSNGMKQVGSEAESSAGKSTNLAQKLANVNEKLENIQKSAHGMNALFDVGAIGEFGRRVGETGDRLLEMGDKFIEAADSGEAAQLSMEAMMKRRGDGGRIQELTEWAQKLSVDAAMVDDDPIKQAAAGLYGFGLNANQVKNIMPGLIGQSRLYHQSLDEVAMSMGKAFASGQTGQLRRIGVVIDQKTLDQIDSISDQGEKQKAIYDAVVKSFHSYALGVREGMGEAEIAANLTANAVDQASESIGKGAEVVSGAWDKAKTHLIGFTNVIPGANFAIGALIEAGGGIAKVFGSTISVVADTARAWMGYMGLMDHLKETREAQALATSLETAATEANTVAAGENAIAQGAAGAAAEGAAVGMEANAAAAGTATAATEGLTVASFAARGGIIGLAIAAGTGLGVALDAVIDKFYKSGNAIYDNLSAMDKLKLKWDALKDFFHIGQNNQVEAQYQIQKAAIENQYNQNRQKGMSAEEAGKIRDAANLKLEQNAAKIAAASKDASHLDEHQKQVDQLEQQQQMQQVISAPMPSPPMPAMPAMPAPNGSQSMPTGIGVPEMPQIPNQSYDINPNVKAAKIPKADNQDKEAEKLARTEQHDNEKEREAALKNQHAQRMEQLKEERQVQSLNNKIALDEIKLRSETNVLQRSRTMQDISKLTAQRDAIQSHASLMGATMNATMMMGRGENSGKSYSHINSDGSVSEYAGNGQVQPQLQTITLHPKTKTTRTAQGGFAIEIVPETIYIPNDFGNAVRGL